MNKTTKRLIVITAIVLVLAIAAFVVWKFFLPEQSTITVPPEQTGFSIDLVVNEGSSYAGVEFALTLSDDSVVFESFSPALESAVASPFIEKDGKHYFGYYSGMNAFEAGEIVAGTMYFTGYTGDDPLTITVEDMRVTRVDENNETVTTSKNSPAYIFVIER